MTFKWTKKQEDSFQTIKRVLSASDMLAYYDRTARTTGVADASPAGLGAILVQCQGGMDKVVAYGHLFDRCGTLLLPDRVFSLGL